MKFMQPEMSYERGYCRPECTKCSEVCPTGASFRSEVDGTVQIDAHKCVGCQYCLYACPYGVRSFDVNEGVAKKCTLCQHLTADGKSKPACVHNCCCGARLFGDLDDPDCELVKEINRTHAEPIAGDLTESKVYYVR